jgi:hypothetical protein
MLVSLADVTAPIPPWRRNSCNPRGRRHPHYLVAAACHVGERFCMTDGHFDLSCQAGRM